MNDIFNFFRLYFFFFAGKIVRVDLHTHSITQAWFRKPFLWALFGLFFLSFSPSFEAWTCGSCLEKQDYVRKFDIGVVGGFCFMMPSLLFPGAWDWRRFVSFSCREMCVCSKRKESVEIVAWVCRGTKQSSFNEIYLLCTVYKVLSSIGCS